MTEIFTHFCLLCNSSWESVTGEADVVCRRCHAQLVDVDEAGMLDRVERINDRAAQDVGLRKSHLDLLRKELAAAELRRNSLIARLTARLRRTELLPGLRSRISFALEALEVAQARAAACMTLPDRLRAARVRYRSREIVREQQREAKRQAFLQSQRDQEVQAEKVLSRLRPHRNTLLIRDADYKRGNVLENFIRQEWATAVHEAFRKRCFLCASATDLTLDHLWMPKNEGGNLAMLVRDGTILVSNVLVLCRSCNSAKGETVVDKFFTSDQLTVLISIQQRLSRRMMTDEKLVKVASKWYGVAGALSG